MPENNEAQTAWFRHTTSGQIFEAEGKQLATARKNRDLEETISPEVAVKMELDKLGVKYQPNTGYRKLAELLAAEQAKVQE